MGELLVRRKEASIASLMIKIKLGIFTYDIPIVLSAKFALNH